MISIKIDNVEKRNVVDYQSLKIKSKLNNEIDECSFTIRKTTTNNYKPNLNDEVIVENDGSKIFGGVIIKMDETASAGNNIIYKIKCVDYSHLLRRQLVTERYENSTIEDIVKDLIDNYTTDSFTYTNVTYDKEVTSFSFNGLTVLECFNKLAKASNALWYVDYNKDVHFFKKNSEKAPFDLTDTSGNYIYNSLSITEDITQLRNKVTVKGGTKKSDTNKIETIVSQDSTQDIFPLGYKFAEKPAVEVNGVSQTVGTEFLEDDSGNDVMWSFNEKYIRFTFGNLPSATDVITIEGKILIPVIVRTPNNDSIGEFGVFEYLIDDKTITTTDEAIERAIVELNSYANELNEGSFQTYNDGLRAGQRMNINSTERGKDIDVIIQDVSIRSVDPEANQIIYNVNFATIKTLGIIEFLQRSLIDEEIEEDANETLLNFIDFEDSLSFSMTDVPVIESLFNLVYVWGEDPAVSGSPATASQSGSDISWSNIDNIKVDDGSNATVGGYGSGASAVSNVLEVTNFGFNIPDDATVLGIKIIINGGTSNTTNAQVHALKAGVQSTNDIDRGNDLNAGTDYYDFGSNTELWGETWTPADINNTNFGATFSVARFLSGFGSASVDHIGIEVTYQDANEMVWNESSWSFEYVYGDAKYGESVWAE